MLISASSGADRPRHGEPGRPSVAAQGFHLFTHSPQQDPVRSQRFYAAPGSGGLSREEILRQYPSLEPEDVDASIAFAAWLMGHGYIVKMTA